MRKPIVTDGAALHALVAECPPLDANSMYCNLLHCTHFAETSVAAVQGGRLVGFISGYLLPHAALPNALPTLFVWQVAVSSAARKRGLASRMLHELLARPACASVAYLHTSINPDNMASRAMFTAFSSALNAPFQETPWFDRDEHFHGAHADEILLTIGPLKNKSGSI